MNKLGWIIPAAAMAAAGCVVVNSERATRTFDVAGFDSVSASQGVNVILKQGPFAISAEGPQAEVERITVDRNGSTLKLGQRPNTNWFFGWSGYTVITVAAPDYTAIEASGGADVDIDPLRLDTLRIKASGGADINSDGLTLDTLDIAASGGADVNTHNVALGELTTVASGGADINVSGACKSLTAEASGGADFNGGDLRCESATITASGGGDAEVTATASATGRASSGGDIRFRGDPVSFQKEESGGGDVTAGR